jgi:HAAS
MAEYSLIEAYLATLREHLPARPDLDDVVAEARDHLYSTVERLQAAGTETRRAQRETLERFGDPDVVGAAFSAPTDGVSLPTRFTRTAGTLAIVGAVLWLALVVFWWVAGAVPPWGDVEWQSGSTASGLFYVLGAATLLGAGGLTFIAVVALNQRHGGLGAIGPAGLLFVGLGLVFCLAAWIFAGWGLLMMVGTILVATAMLRRGIAPRLPTLALGGALVAGALTWTVVRVANGTLVDFSVGLWDDQWVVNLTGVTIAAVILAVGLAGLGGWLRSEEPTDVHTDRALSI